MSSLRTYWSLLGSHFIAIRGRLLVLTLVIVLNLAIDLAAPWIVKQFIDIATGGGAVETLAVLAMLFLVASIAGQAVRVAVIGMSADIGAGATNALRDTLVARVLRLDLPFHHVHLPGEMIQRLDSDVQQLTLLFSSFVARVATSALLLIGVLVLVTLIDWRTGLVMGAYIAVLVLAILRARPIASRQFRGLLAATAASFSFLEERLGGLEDLKANGATPYLFRRFTTVFRERLRWAVRAQAIGEGGVTTAINGGSAVGAIAIAAGAWLLSAGATTIGTVYLLFDYSQRIVDPLRTLARQLDVLQRAAAAISRIHDLARTVSALPDGRGVPIPPGPLSVELDAVTFAYGAEPVLHGVSIAIRPGASLGLLGRTGSGKTTIGRLVARLYDVRDGQVRVGGVDVRDAYLDELRSRIGVVTQDIQIFGASLRDNLTLFREVDDARILSVLEDLGLGAWLASLPDGLDTGIAGGQIRLSAGEAQLLAFARVFLRDPDIVILDEASSRLDPVTERGIAHAVDRLLAGRTAIVIAHRLETLDRVDDIAILDAGRVVESGPRERLAGDPDSLYARLRSGGLVEVTA